MAPKDVVLISIEASNQRKRIDIIFDAPKRVPPTRGLLVHSW